MYHLIVSLFRYQYFEILVREAVFLKDCSSVGTVTRLEVGKRNFSAYYPSFLQINIASPPPPPP